MLKSKINIKDSFQGHFKDRILKNTLIKVSTHF
jgi:hypothetical protein